MEERLEDVVNIGPALAHDLRAAGIEDPEALRAVGACDAWLRLNATGARDCLLSLLALEGAVRGVRWLQLSPADRDALSARARAARDAATLSAPAPSGGSGSR